MAAADFHLASASLRRRQLLDQLGYRYDVRPVDLPEVPSPGQSPEDFVVHIALAKARAAGDLITDGLPVLAADTDVALDGIILGKPADAAGAARLLRLLSGRRHRVYSAVVVMAGTRAEHALSISEIDFAPIDETDLLAYCAAGEPLGKAGAYAIQGYAARWVRRLEGSYAGVVGLPIFETVNLLSGFGIAPFPLRAAAA